MGAIRWAVIALVLGCRSPRPEPPVIFNRAEPSSVPPTGDLGWFKPKHAIYWEDQCYSLNSNPFCVLSPGRLRCGCCPPQYPLWVCRQMF